MPSTLTKRRKKLLFEKIYCVELQSYIPQWLPEGTYLYVPDSGLTEPRKSFHSLAELQYCILWQKHSIVEVQRPRLPGKTHLSRLLLSSPI